MNFADGLFSEKVVVVTGGTSGIGATTADLFADLGAHVFAAGLIPTGPTHRIVTGAVVLTSTFATGMPLAISSETRLVSTSWSTARGSAATATNGPSRYSTR